MADCQFAALALRRGPLQHRPDALARKPDRGPARETRIDWRAKKVEFEKYLDKLRRGRSRSALRSGLRITSGPASSPRRVAASPGCGLRSGSYGMNGHGPLVVGGGPAGLAAAHARRVGRQPSGAGREGCDARRRADPVRLRQARAVGAVGEGCDRRHGTRVESDNARDDPQSAPTSRRSTARPAISSRRCRTARRSKAGAAILATGFTHFDSVNKPEWGFGTFPTS